MAESPIDEQELLRQLAQGQEWAFEQFYQRFQGPIYRFTLHMSGNAATAEEVTQEVFMVLIDNPRGYDPGKGKLISYLFGVARNLTRRSLERIRLDLPLMDEILGEEEVEAGAEAENGYAGNERDVLTELSRSEMLESLRKAVVTLPELYREAVVLCDLEEMSYLQAAGVLGCSPGTVASRLHRGRNLLKVKLQTVFKGQPCAK
ncbi:MAG TPA: RNA polymerase sigma factor [Candidatus Saccharimonadales bacterium]|jgi:RNA polymerase sigma-70 factor (ECF subfamily)|nr:RNA polymerase sigma factor [Candidatus Saccharimonadales bacterium]